MAPRRDRDLPRIPSSEDRSPFRRPARKSRDDDWFVVDIEAESNTRAQDEIPIESIQVTDPHRAVWDVLRRERDSMGLSTRPIIQTGHDEVTVSVPSRTVEVEFDESSAERRAVARPPGYWKLRNGKFIVIREMDDSHLFNCISMCERNSQARGRIPIGGVYQELVEERNRRVEQAQQLQRQQAGTGYISSSDRYRLQQAQEAAILRNRERNTIIQRDQANRIGRIDTFIRNRLEEAQRAANQAPAPVPTPQDVQRVWPPFVGGRIQARTEWVSPVQDVAPPPPQEPISTTIPEDAPKRRIKTNG